MAPVVPQALTPCEATGAADEHRPSEGEWCGESLEKRCPRGPVRALIVELAATAHLARLGLGVRWGLGVAQLLHINVLGCEARLAVGEVVVELSREAFVELAIRGHAALGHLTHGLGSLHGADGRQRRREARAPDLQRFRVGKRKGARGAKVRVETGFLSAITEHARAGKVGTGKDVLANKVAAPTVGLITLVGNKDSLDGREAAGLKCR
mmetsp:Transcript_617/g.1710  ORF Transcript_617/g.1710 Transcript_617/m.1710 type:complete len:210 (+) Transcript_617:1253-1882(+)